MGSEAEPGPTAPSKYDPVAAVDSLPHLVAQAYKRLATAYDALLQAGYLRPAAEYLEAES